MGGVYKPAINILRDLLIEHTILAIPSSATRVSELHSR
jgi:hypothetical protein